VYLLNGIKKAPTYNAFVKYMHEIGITDWIVDAHESWELPPVFLLRKYFYYYPLDLTINCEIVDYVPTSHRTKIYRSEAEKINAIGNR
jgi:hypothetical protein